MPPTAVAAAPKAVAWLYLGPAVIHLYQTWTTFRAYLREIMYVRTGRGRWSGCCAKFLPSSLTEESGTPKSMTSQDCQATCLLLLSSSTTIVFNTRLKAIFLRFCMLDILRFSKFTNHVSYVLSKDWCMMHGDSPHSTARGPHKTARKRNLSIKQFIKEVD